MFGDPFECRIVKKCYEEQLPTVCYWILLNLLNGIRLQWSFTTFHDIVNELRKKSALE